MPDLVHLLNRALAKDLSPNHGDTESRSFHFLFSECLYDPLYGTVTAMKIGVVRHSCRLTCARDINVALLSSLGVKLFHDYSRFKKEY